MECVPIHISWPFRVFHGHLVHFGVIWYIFPRFGMLYREKSGNLGASVRGCRDATSTFKLPTFKMSTRGPKMMTRNNLAV
jgi:hypothetical protein